MKSGSQAPAGLYLVPFYSQFGADRINGRFGNPLPVQGQFNLYAGAVAVAGVTKQKILGANYGFTIVPAIGSPALELPRFGANASMTGFADMYIQPLNLGWHRNRFDAVAGYAFFAPTGRYTHGASDNIGLGMWSHEFSLGGTAFLDPGKKWHVAGTGYYETHTRKQDADVQVGDILTIEGGLGRDFLKGAASVGAAYYCQWKMTTDSGGAMLNVPGIDQTKHRFYGVGPEVNFPIVDKSKTKLIALLTFRYYWEFSSISAFQGQKLYFGVTFPTKILTK